MLNPLNIEKSKLKSASINQLELNVVQICSGDFTHLSKYVYNLTIIEKISQHKCHSKKPYHKQTIVGLAIIVI